MKYWILGIILFGIILSTNILADGDCSVCINQCIDDSSYTYQECMCLCVPTCLTCNLTCGDEICTENIGEDLSTCPADCSSNGGSGTLNCNTDYQIELYGYCFPFIPSTPIYSETSKVITPWIFGNLRIKGEAQDLNYINASSPHLFILNPLETKTMLFIHPSDSSYSINNKSTFIMSPSPSGNKYSVNYLNYFNNYFAFTTPDNTDVNINTPFRLYK